jgi:demethylmenaquinone methyltransferase/2-methoxy-6-polyprenyl-1,4-benzoquinol methylase
VLGPLREALGGAPGRRLVDVGGGTGNYSFALREEGWRPLVVDRQPQMLARAAAKGLETLQGDAQKLPLADESADAVMRDSSATSRRAPRRGPRAGRPCWRT